MFVYVYFFNYVHILFPCWILVQSMLMKMIVKQDQKEKGRSQAR